MKYETEENALQKGSQAVQENRQQNAQAQLTQDNSSRRIPTLKCADKKQLDEVKAPQDLLQQDTPLNSIHRGDGTTAKSVKTWRSEFTGYIWLIGNGTPKIKASRKCDSSKMENGAKGTYSTRQAVKQGKEFRIK